ncbi:nuclear transport factor 2 family protein [Haloterrigena alkaliphila]|uniref:DUF3225 domain-containing protein n=1 Tax=Haloterrigena alkaliphila TaxID=2816475 RepID=A0A8A2VC49_9EURY|nr:nuclear transport factor 2 family protein [Haloterrigena alkaliphila]QSW99613.1 nuclear transport factor 2 family protein [Haloterrigena alkaliphila]
MSDRAESVVGDYYDALRNGDALAPYFLEAESTVKFGISESLFGFDAVSEALREQTETTAEWAVESRRLTVDERDGVAAFADAVTMNWTDTETGERKRFETRWSGTLVRTAGANDDASDDETEPPAWQFATLHVSTADEL